MLNDYDQQVQERAAMGIPPRALTQAQVESLLPLLRHPKPEQNAFLQQLFEQRVCPGVDEAAEVKAQFLYDIAIGHQFSPLITPEHAVFLLGTMQGGYNIPYLILLLDHAQLAEVAANALSESILIFDAFQQVADKAKQGNTFAYHVIERWANADWFVNRRPLADKVTLTVFKVSGEITTDDLSPAPSAWSRPDIPLHALVMLAKPREGVEPDHINMVGPISQLTALKQKGFPLVFVGDVVGTGSSRKSATNSLLWYIGQDIPYVPNKRQGGFVFGGKIAPIFYNTLEDSGAFPLEMDVSKLQTGDVIDLYPYQGEIRCHQTQTLITTFSIKTNTLFDEVRAGGRIALVIGRRLTQRARSFLNLPHTEVFTALPPLPCYEGGYTLAQKIVGRACGVKGVRPGQYVEPVITTVGSQDTTGGMTRDELKDLACLHFSADLVMQSFCHTAAYPNKVDLQLQQSLPHFMTQRGGVALQAGDGIIHSWLNRMLLPDTVGTGGDSHTRFPIGISFPAGSGLVAFAAASGVMPLDMPESVLVRFTGTLQAGITLRDVVHAIPYVALQRGELTLDKKGKKNVFSGRILEIEGLSHLTVEQAFELADASAERSAAACTIKLDEQRVIDYIRSNIALLTSLIQRGYQNSETLQHRIDRMQAWLDKPELLSADEHADYHTVLEINLSEITEPLVCCPNDPDDVKPLSLLGEEAIQEVFIGSCMTNIGHFRATGSLLADATATKARLWLAPPTVMDSNQLKKEGFFDIFARVGARIEPAGCSLCMGNQARVQTGSTVVSTSTRNFPNRLGDNTLVYLASAELAAITAILGRFPSLNEYQQCWLKLNRKHNDIYRYLDFSQHNWLI